MAELSPAILALDFDGVVCDGLIEYFQTAWLAYCHIYSPDDRQPPAGLADRFYRLRPVVESGWEMPLLIQALLMGIPDAELFANWGTLAPQQAAAIGQTPAELAAVVDHVRDRWIAEDLDNWLAQHRFYPGIIDRLRQTIASPVRPYIISTKEQRFIDQLLRQQQVELPTAQIIGKEVKRPKADTLRILMQQSPNIWFIEDRFKTLQGIAPQPDLEHIQLFLADWGYNTEAERDTARHDPRIHVLSLSDVANAFSDWP